MLDDRSRRLCAILIFFGSGTVASLQAADEPLPPAIVATLKGHAETVYTVSFSPVGRYVLTGSFDKSLKLWEAVSGKEIKTFGGQAGHQNLILAASFSPDGRMVASGSSDNTAKLWDTPFSLPLREYAHTDGVNAVALSPDGSKLAGAGKDGVIKLWAAIDGKQLANLTGHAGAATSVSFGGNGQFLASSGVDRTIRFWNPANGQSLGVLGAHSSAVNAVVAQANGNALFSAGDDGVLKSWKVPVAGSRTMTALGDSVHIVVLATDGSTLLSVGADKNLRLSNFDNGQLIRQWKGPAAPVTALAISPNKTIAAAGTSDGKLYLWNTADGKSTKEVAAHTGRINAITFHPQGTQALTAGQDGTLKLWSLAPAKKPGPADEKPLKTIDAHQGGALAVAINRDGTQVVSGGADKIIKLWNLATGQLVRPVASVSEPVSALGFSRDYTQLVAAAGRRVKIWNANDGKELLDLNHPEAVTSFSLSPDKTKVATGSTDKLAHVWDTKTGIELQFFSHTSPVHSVAFQNNNSSILFASKEKPPVLSTLSIVRAIRASTLPVHGLALAAGGSLILTASNDKSVQLWNANSGVNERIFAGAEAPVRAVAVSQSGTLVATGDIDRNVRVYGLADARLLATFKAPGEVVSVGFTPNSQILAAACSDKSIVTWEVVYRPGQPLPAEFGKPGQTFAHAGAATGVAFAADNVTIYTAGLDKTLKAWKFASNVPIKNFGHGNYVDAVAFNPAGTQLASGGHEGIVRIWDVAKGQVVRQINAHTAPPAPAPIYCLAWSPDGKQIVSGSLDRSLKLWDASNGTLVKEFKGYKEKEFEKGHRDGVFCVVFSPDGKTLVSGGSDHTIKFWNVATGAVLRECVNPKLKGNGAAGAAAAAHPGAIYGLGFAAGGQRLVSAGHAARNHGYLAVWDAADGRLLYGQELELGNINNLAVSPDSKYLAVACSPRGRNLQEANAYVIKMPGTDTRQTTRAGK